LASLLWYFKKQTASKAQGGGCSFILNFKF